MNSSAVQLEGFISDPLCAITVELVFSVSIQQMHNYDFVIATAIVMPELDSIFMPKAQTCNFKLTQGPHGSGIAIGNEDEIILSDLGYDAGVEVQVTCIIAPSIQEPPNDLKA